jgi:hypothetical protein
MSGQPGHSEICLKCSTDLRACLNCGQHDLRVSQQCRERCAEPVLEKDNGNFCEYFDFIRRPWRAKCEINSRKGSGLERMPNCLEQRRVFMRASRGFRAGLSPQARR